MNTAISSDNVLVAPRARSNRRVRVEASLEHVDPPVRVEDRLVLEQYKGRTERRGESGEVQAIHRVEPRVCVSDERRLVEHGSCRQDRW